MANNWVPMMYLSMVIVEHVTGTTIHNRASGLLSASPDVSDTHPLYFETGFDVALPSGVYSVFGTSVNYLRCFDFGYCYCSDSQISKTVTDDYPATADPVGTGMYTTGSSSCLLAPFVAPKNKPSDPETGNCPYGTDLEGNCVNCPTGYTEFERRCYKVHKPPTYNEAKAACVSEDGDLVSLDTMSFFDHIAGEVSESNSYWTGANDITTEGSFVWPNEQPVTFGWFPGEPNNAGSGEDCSVLRGVDGTLNDDNCGNRKGGYICEKPGNLMDCWDGTNSQKYTGSVSLTENGRTCQAWSAQVPHVHRFRSDDFFPLDSSVAGAENYCRDPDNWGRPWCYTTNENIRWEPCDVPVCTCPEGYIVFEDRCYKIYTTSLTFAGARAACETDNADLVSLDTTAFCGQIVGEVSGPQDYWIGANDFDTEGSFVCHNGRPVVGEWGLNEPNNGGGGEDCASLRGNYGTFSDFPCGRTVDGYICEKSGHHVTLNLSTRKTLTSCGWCTSGTTK